MKSKVGNYFRNYFFNCGVVEVMKETDEASGEGECTADILLLEKALVFPLNFAVNEMKLC